ncbi:cytidine deaminase [Yaniella halotolerans]|uniref:cytidine deaminase n=1 Tax=Yaniella halotolerans TaxID=225453 RepID=UPI0003B4DB2B|nr:cytidine deaminase [Yaniella halotolerans]
MEAHAQLHAVASEVLPRAYAPYSQHPVAAAALDTAGVIHTGVNIENASYGVTLCAECSLISSWRLNAGAELTHLVCLNAAREYITPCGRCRQLLYEHAPVTLSIATQHGPITLGELLPMAFGPENL